MEKIKKQKHLYEVVLITRHSAFTFKAMAFSHKQARANAIKKVAEKHSVAYSLVNKYLETNPDKIKVTLIK